MTSLLTTISATINHYKDLFMHNDTVAKQAAHDWQSRYCAKHHVPRFYNIMKAQAGKPELECWTCNLCEYERRQQALAEPKPTPYSNSPLYFPGSMLLAVNAKVEECKQELITRIALSRIPTFPAKPPTSPLAARDIQYASTPPIEDDPDATEMRPAIKLSKSTPTLEIPAITGEILLMEIMRKPASPHDTGEQEPVKVSEINEDAFLL